MGSRTLSLAGPFLLLLAVAACGGGSGSDTALTGQVEIDGSSTVFPVAVAVAEEYQIANPSVRVTVGFSGSGGGFKRFCAGELDLTNASRPIRDLSWRSRRWR